MEIFLAFAPPVLAALLTFFLSCFWGKHSQKSKNSTTEFKITISHRSFDGEPQEPLPPHLSKHE